MRYAGVCYYVKRISESIPRTRIAPVCVNCFFLFVVVFVSYAYYMERCTGSGWLALIVTRVYPHGNRVYNYVF